MQYCTRNPSIKKPELSDAASIIDINDNMDVIDSIICKSNFNGVTDPSVNDDVGDGYSVGSNWWNVTDHRLFVAESVATGAAVWRQVWPALDSPTLRGGTGSGDDIEITPTSHATKGVIKLTGSNTNIDPSLTFHADCATWIETAGLQLAMGCAVNAPYAFWMQARQSTDVIWPLVINPLGGRVGIGLSDPQAQLNVSADCLVSNADYPTYLLLSQLTGAKKWGFLSGAGDLVVRNVTDGVNVIHIYNSGGMSLGSSVVDPGANNLYVTGDVNCASVTDHTPAYEGDAVAEIKAIKSTKNGMIDHASLPKFCQKKYLDKEGDEQIGRDLGATISILVEAIKQLTARIEKLENK
jgi:hypothetical protein